MRGDYDYHHASSNTQFLTIIFVMMFGMLAGGGLVLGLALLGVMF